MYNIAYKLNTVCVQRGIQTKHSVCTVVHYGIQTKQCVYNTAYKLNTVYITTNHPRRSKVIALRYYPWPIVSIK